MLSNKSFASLFKEEQSHYTVLNTQLKGMPLSIAKKLLILTLGIVSISLFSLTIIVLQSFYSDKRSYIFDSVKTNSDVAASQIHGAVDKNFQKMNTFLRGFSKKSPKIHRYGRSLLSVDKDMRWLAIYSAQPGRKKSFQLHDSAVRVQSLNAFNKHPNRANRMIEGALRANRFVSAPLSEEALWISMPLLLENQVYVAVAELAKPPVFESFKVPRQSLSFLTNEAFSEILAGPRTGGLPQDQWPAFLKAFSSAIAKRDASTNNAQGGMVFSHGDTDFMTVVSPTEAGSLNVVTLTPLSYISDSSQYLSTKVILFSIFLFGLTIVCSVLGATYLTRRIKQLTQATGSIAKGKFGIQVSISGKDEVGILAKGFNKMSLEIQRLLDETVEKVRMESELETARTVQSTLFPKAPLIDDQSIEIHGFYESASECSGDWWSYYKSGDDYYIWLGDATGHGVSAALVTASVKSTLASMEPYKGLSLTDILNRLNYAIFETAQAQVAMTMFFGAYNAKTRTLRYINASHEAPVLVDRGAIPDSHKELDFLSDVGGPRIGHHLEANFLEQKLPIKENQSLFIYTDGVYEIENMDGKMIGERKLLKTLIQLYKNEQYGQSFSKALTAQLFNFRGEAALKDDITFVAVDFK